MNSIYRILNLIALGIVCYFIGTGQISLIGYFVSCVLAWNVIEGNDEDTYKNKVEELKNDILLKNVKIAMLELKNKLIDK